MFNERGLCVSYLLQNTVCILEVINQELYHESSSFSNKQRILVYGRIIMSAFLPSNCGVSFYTLWTFFVAKRILLTIPLMFRQVEDLEMF